MRTYVITGAASGIGAATADRIRADGHHVVGVDLRDAEVIADLGTDDGRRRLVAEIESRAGAVDAVVANAGLMGDGATMVRVNFFGAVATLEGLRPLLARGTDPRAAATASVAALHQVHDGLVAACLDHDEASACAIAVDEHLHAITVYASTKRALARWVRTRAPMPDWAGAGIALNAVAPGTIRTPMTQPLLDDPAFTDILDASVPMPFGGVAEPDAVAAAFAFLTAAGTARITGQVLFVDGGADCVLRGNDVFG